MMRKQTNNTPLFEELESRLLFSADIGEAFAAGAVVEEYVEEPVIVAELEPGQEITDIAVDQPSPEREEVDVKRQAEPLSGKHVEPEFDDTLSSEEPTTEKSEDTETAEAELTLKAPLLNSIEGPATEAVEVQQPTEDPEATGTRVELVLINDTVRDKEQLIGDLQQSDTEGQSYEVVILDSATDGIDQVGTILKDYENLDALHIITHGSDGQISLGGSWINSVTIEGQGSTISDWSNALSETGDILFYGCNTAAGDEGLILLERISSLTGADVAASEDITGNAAMGGDWDLEHSIGTIETRSAISSTGQQEWLHTLADPIVTLPGGDLSYSAGSGAVIIDALATVTDVDSPNFDTGQLVVSFTSGGTENDLLAIRNQGNSIGDISVAGSNIMYHVTNPPVIIGSFSGGTDGSTPLTILFNSNSSPEAVQAVLRNLTYENISPTPDTSPRTVRFELQDGDGGANGLLTRIINFTGVNELPTITSDGGGDIASITVTELTSSVTTVVATDNDGDVPTFSITGGADQAHFSITPDGALSFVNPQDFENPTDSDSDRVYEVVITADDSHGGTDVQAIMVSVTDINEAPTLVSLSSISLDENTDTSGGCIVGNLTCSDQDNSDTATYSIVGGVDAPLFSINGTSLLLDNGILDFETQSAYEVILRVTDSGGLSADRLFVVGVNDLNDGQVLPPDSEEGGDDTASNNITNSTDSRDSTGKHLPARNGDITSSINEELDLRYGIRQASNHEAADLSEPAINSTYLEEPEVGWVGLEHYEIDPGEIENTRTSENRTEKNNQATEKPKTTPEAEITADLSLEEIENLIKEPLALSPQISEESRPETKHRALPVKFASQETYSSLLLKNLYRSAEESFTDTYSPDSNSQFHQESLYLGDPDLLSESMQLEVDSMIKDMDRSYEKEAFANKVEVVLTSGFFASIAAGAAGYMLRAGSLVSSFLATVPMWKGFDPVGVLLKPTGAKTVPPQQEQPENTTTNKQEEIDWVEENLW